MIILGLLRHRRTFFSSPGVKNADENELKDIASPPVDTHVYNVPDFNLMNDIVDGLTKVICDRVEQLDKQLRGENISYCFLMQ